MNPGYELQSVCKYIQWMLHFDIPSYAYVDMEMEWKWKWNNSVIEQAGAEDRKLGKVALLVTDPPIYPYLLLAKSTYFHIFTYFCNL